MSEHEAIQALEELGLTKYEAKVFIALQRLGSGTAREVSQASDVPRPQVYSSAESLERWGLVDIQQSEPTRYRPVTITEAKATLQNRFDRSQETAFEYIESVHTEGKSEEQREDIWTISGQATITNRISHLIREAEQDVLLAVDSLSVIGPEVIAALRDAATEGVSVSIYTPDPAVAEQLGTVAGITVTDEGTEEHETATGRLLVVDEKTVLLSAFGEQTENGLSETAIWSSETEFARVLIRLTESHR